MCVGQEEQLQVQERYPQKRVIHLPNGVDVDRFANGNRTAFRKQYGIPAQARMVLTVGRIDPQKNQLFAVDLLPQLREIDPDTHLVLIGHVTNEAYFTRLVREIEARGLKNHVTVIRGLNADSQDLVDAYHAADIFLLPSIHEPFGIVILEAWAAGLPVLASRVGGVPSFVNHGENGLLCKTNDKKEFCRAFRMVVDCKEMGRALACMGQRKAQSNYAWEHITSQLANLYEDVRREHSVCQ